MEKKGGGGSCRTNSKPFVRGHYLTDFTLITIFCSAGQNGYKVLTDSFHAA